MSKSDYLIIWTVLSCRMSVYYFSWIPHTGRTSAKETKTLFFLLGHPVYESLNHQPFQPLISQKRSFRSFMPISICPLHPLKYQKSLLMESVWLVRIEPRTMECLEHIPPKMTKRLCFIDKIHALLMDNLNYGCLTIELKPKWYIVIH